jgi:parvulin-like peptidyl-prolyl isomerase
MSGARRSGLVIFGVLLIALFGGIAIAQGIGNPSVPSGDIALVEEVPGDAGNISKEQYERAFLQTWKRGGLQQAPEPGNAQYQQIKEAAINDNLDQAWLTGEAAELGVTATNREIDTEFQTIRQDQFPSEQAFQQFLKDSDFTLPEVRDRVELQVLSRKIEEQITSGVTEVPQDLIEQTYEDSKDSFTTPETRDISLIVTDNAADAKKVEAALSENSDEKQFAKLARQYSTHGSSSQGGETVATEGAFPDPAGSEIMSAPEGELVGPVEVDGDTYFFKVNRINPEETQTLEEVTPQLRQQLLPTLQQQAMTDFVEAYNSKWKARTFCAEGFIVERCDNFVGDGRLESADPACYEDGASDPAQPLACPAPVPLRAPQAPGGNSLDPFGVGGGGSLPQGPVPPGDAAAAGAGAGAAGAGAGAVQIPAQ